MYKRLLVSIIAIMFIMAIIIPAVPALAYTSSTTPGAFYQGDICRVARTSGSTVDFNLTDVAAGYYNSTFVNLESGMRFESVQIPQGSTINSAYLQFTGFNAASDASPATGTSVRTRFYGEARSNPPVFSSYAEYSTRFRTSTYADWVSSQPWTTGQQYNSTDLRYVVQEVVQRYDWSSGYSLVLFWVNNNTGDTNGKWRRAYAYGTDDTEPMLYVNYTYNDTTYSGTYDLSGITSQITAMATNVDKLQTQLTTTATSVTTLGSKIDTLVTTISQGQANTQQAVNNALATNTTLKDLSTQLTSTNTQMTQLNSNMSTISASLKTIDDNQVAIAAQVKDMQSKSSSGTIAIVLVIAVISLLMNLLILAALRRRS